MVTGGAGFIGSHLTERLLNEGHDVVVLDNFITGRVENLNAHPNLKVVRQDVTDFIDIEGDLDAVFHLASPASPLDFERYPIQVLKAGALGTHKTLGLAKHKRARYLLASTSEVYGDPLVHPQPETYRGNVNPIGVRGVYDEAKRYAEALTMAYHRMHQVDTRIVRIFNTYGPRMRFDDGRVIPSFVHCARNGFDLPIFGDGMQTRSFCYVDDTVSMLLHVLNQDRHEPVNIGSEDEKTILDLAKAIEIAFGRKLGRQFLPAINEDPHRRRPDLTVLRELGFQKDLTKLEEGLRVTISIPV